MRRLPARAAVVAALAFGFAAFSFVSPAGATQNDDDGSWRDGAAIVAPDCPELPTLYPQSAGEWRDSGEWNYDDMCKPVPPKPCPGEEPYPVPPAGAMRPGANRVVPLGSGHGDYGDSGGWGDHGRKKHPKTKVPPTPTCTPPVTTTPPTPTPTETPTPTATPSGKAGGEQLPTTGVDAAPALGMSAGLVAVGAVLVGFARRRVSQQ